MPSRRIERINEQLRAEISELISRQMKDPRLHGMISVTEVETASDMRHAKVFVSILGTDQERAESFATLQRATGFFRHELRDRLRIKRTPELELRLDTSIERADHLMRLLRQVEAEGKSAQPPAAGDLDAAKPGAFDDEGG